MGLTKAQLEALNDSSFPNNTVGYITPTILRDYNDAVILNTVNQDVYLTDSASFDSRIDNVTFDTSSLVSTASFNAYTQSTNQFTASISTSVGLLQTFSGSQYKADSASFNGRINNISAPVGYVTTSSFNAYTSSNDTRVNNLTNATASYALSSSVAAVDIAQDGRIASLTALTASTAYTNVNNSFAGTQSFNNVIVNGTASIAFLNVTYQSSSVVYSSGSNIFGDNANEDTQKLEGRVIVTGSFEVTGSSRFNGNVSITGSANVNGSPVVVSSQTSSMAVSSSTYAVTASYAVNAQTASEARNLIVIARNGNQSTLNAGTVVHITSAAGDNPIFNTASFDTELLSANTLGILRSTLTSGADGEVVVNGIVTGVNTDPTLGYAAGDVVYLSASGQFTKVQPQAPNQVVVLGQVLRAQQNNGSLYVSINNGWELNELHNVQINTPLTNDLLAYESSSYGLWKNKSFSSLGLATTSSLSSFITTGSATTASQTVLGDFNFNTSYTGSEGVVNQAGGTNVLGIDYGAFTDLLNYWGGLNFAGVLVNGTGVTNASITSYNFGAYLEATLSSGTTTNGATYTLTGPALQDISITGSLQATYEVRARDTATGQKAVMDVRGVYSLNADSTLQAGVSTDGGVYTNDNTNGNGVRLAISSSQVSNGVYNGAQIAVNQNNAGTFTQIGFEGNNNYTNGRITVYQPLFLTQSLSVTGSATFAELTGSLASFSSSVDSRLDATATTGSNNFVGNQTITGSLTLSSSLDVELNVIGNTVFSGSMAFSSSVLNVVSGSSSGSIVTNVGDTFTGTAAVTKIISLSSAEYTALGTKDPNTLYIIV